MATHSLLGSRELTVLAALSIAERPATQPEIQNRLRHAGIPNVPDSRSGAMWLLMRGLEKKGFVVDRGPQRYPKQRPCARSWEITADGREWLGKQLDELDRLQEQTCRLCGKHPSEGICDGGDGVGRSALRAARAGEE